MRPTTPPTARCLSCRQRRLSSDLCPVCQCCSEPGCGCSGECDRLAQETELRQEVEQEAALFPWLDDPSRMDAEVEP